jgi:ferredoxin
MPKKYHIDVHETPHRYPAIGRSGIVDWGEGCLKCARCVKYDCVYDAYRHRTFSSLTFGDTIEEFCKGCFRCVQACPARLIHKTLNAEWENLGDDVYTPEIISTTSEQARTGKIPVSGAGYGGPFTGPGFDSMWTDMSEIVRPTRDGIHGREYISTVVDIGRRPASLEFDPAGTVTSLLPTSIRIPIPLIFDLPPFGDLSPDVWRALAGAAQRLGTRFVAPLSEIISLSAFRSSVIPLLDENDDWAPELLATFDMVEIWDSPRAFDRLEALKRVNSGLIVGIRTPATLANADRIVDLARSGADVIHSTADARGYEPGIERGAHIRDVIRTMHTRLIEAGLRDEVTLMAGGGIAMAEHVIKAILCGVNLVGVDVPLLMALECRVCRNCAEGGGCPVSISGIDPAWGSDRIVNLMAAWHNQLLEIMGAMGIREARRLRGEQGRVMFVEDLEAETFGRLFGAARTA